MADDEELDAAVVEYLRAHNELSEAFTEAFLGATVDKTKVSRVVDLQYESLRLWKEGLQKWPKEWAIREYELRPNQHRRSREIFMASEKVGRFVGDYRETPLTVGCQICGYFVPVTPVHGTPENPCISSRGAKNEEVGDDMITALEARLKDEIEKDDRVLSADVTVDDSVSTSRLQIDVQMETTSGPVDIGLAISAPKASIKSIVAALLDYFIS